MCVGLRLLFHSAQRGGGETGGKRRRGALAALLPPLTSGPIHADGDGRRGRGAGFVGPRHAVRGGVAWEGPGEAAAVAEHLRGRGRLAHPHLRVVQLDDLPLGHGQGVQDVLPVERLAELLKVRGLVKVSGQHLGGEAGQPGGGEEEAEAEQALHAHHAPRNVHGVLARLLKLAEAEGHVEDYVEDGQLHVRKDHVDGGLL
mmetsp:Transcript_24741/g.63353  ORF Transcript_24741/g.63353 Transcript_24741/m.63353 type:complete len:201 (+) Transcript_24741:1551-2153(+)